VSAVYVIGDIHGQYDKLVALLRYAKLADEQINWCGGSATLWFMGDFFDRGPNGIGAVDLVMQLQVQAASAGGAVKVLLGNHDLLLLAAHEFGNYQPLLLRAHQSGQEVPIEAVDLFTAGWLRNGGELSDLVRLNRKHIRWFSTLPAMAHEQGKLLAHADSTLYQRYGDSVEQVNQFFHSLFQNGSTDNWSKVLDAFSEHEAFVASNGQQRAALFLKIFGGNQLIHGHTPIDKITHQTATEALVYAGGLCVNVDGGMSRGGDGFVYRLA
jgi:hypothetical protein